MRARYQKRLGCRLPFYMGDKMHQLNAGAKAHIRNRWRFGSTAVAPL